jgi:hypothetical protein
MRTDATTDTIVDRAARDAENPYCGAVRPRRGACRSRDSGRLSHPVGRHIDDLHPPVRKRGEDVLEIISEHRLTPRDALMAYAVGKELGCRIPVATIDEVEVAPHDFLVQIVPSSLVAELQRFRVQLGGAFGGLMSPSESDPAVAIMSDVFSKWLLAAEEMADCRS